MKRNTPLTVDPVCYINYDTGRIEDAPGLPGWQMTTLCVYDQRAWAADNEVVVQFVNKAECLKYNEQHAGGIIAAHVARLYVMSPFY